MRQTLCIWNIQGKGESEPSDKASLLSSDKLLSIYTLSNSEIPRLRRLVKITKQDTCTCDNPVYKFVRLKYHKKLIKVKRFIKGI